MSRQDVGSAGSWGAGVIRLHWAIALAVLLVLVSGYTAEHGAVGPAQTLLYEVHFSLGLLTLVLALVRLGWRLRAGSPSGRPGPRLQNIAASLVHVLLYMTLFAALVSGWTNFMFLGPVRIFGLIEVPRLFDPETQEPLRALAWYVHYYSYWLLVALVSLHAAAALYHHWVIRDRTLLDFLPRR